MTHRQRVKMALSFQTPDRVPLDMWGTDSRLIDPFYFKVLEHLGWKDKGEVERPGKTAQYVDWRLSDLFDCDFRHLTARKPSGYLPRKDPDGTVYDEWGVGYQKRGEHTFISSNPFPEADLAAIEKHPWPDMRDPSRFEGMAERAKHWFETTDYAITTTTPVSGLIMDLYQYVRGTENFFMDLCLEKTFAHALIDKIAEVMETLYVNMVRPLAPYVAWVEFATDYGTQNGLFISPEMYREFLKGPEQRIFAAVKKVAPEAKIFMHSCGAIKRLIPDLLDAGVEVLSALQPLAFEMDSAELKREFGRELVFHGGIDMQQALVGTREQTVAETLKRLRDYAPGGGYICSPSNHFTSDVPVENFFALYETARDYRG
jgi:uroporphyrinogen decarboxylase